MGFIFSHLFPVYYQQTHEGNFHFVINLNCQTDAV